MDQRVVISGFGGQGIMSMAQLIVYAGMMDGKNVSWVPSYGPEMRGGTAYCNLVVSDMKIGSPVVTKPNTLIVMNLPSLIKFEKSLVPNGLLLMNSSIISQRPARNDIRPYGIKINDLAVELGNLRTANMIMLGAYVELTKAVSDDSVFASIKKVLGGAKKELVSLNIDAFKLGAKSVHAMCAKI